jgi:hypothetical protein
MHFERESSMDRSQPFGLQNIAQAGFRASTPAVVDPFQMLPETAPRSLTVESQEKNLSEREPISSPFPVWIGRSGDRVVLRGDRLESKSEIETREGAATRLCSE